MVVNFRKDLFQLREIDFTAFFEFHFDKEFLQFAVEVVMSSGIGRKDLLLALNLTRYIDSLNSTDVISLLPFDHATYEQEVVFPPLLYKNRSPA